MENAYKKTQLTSWRKVTCTCMRTHVGSICFAVLLCWIILLVTDSASTSIVCLHCFVYFTYISTYLIGTHTHTHTSKVNKQRVMTATEWCSTWEMQIIACMQCRSDRIRVKSAAGNLWRDAASAVDGWPREKNGKGATLCTPRLMPAFDQRVLRHKLPRGRFQGPPLFAPNFHHIARSTTPPLYLGRGWTKIHREEKAGHFFRVRVYFPWFGAHGCSIDCELEVFSRNKIK